jgi:hypothetical protein
MVESETNQIGRHYSNTELQNQRDRRVSEGIKELAVAS